MLRYVLQDRRLFESRDPAERADSEDTLLFDLENLTDRNERHLRRHPNTPKLYESGVEYALPEQMAECKINPKKLRECRDYLRSLGAGEDTIEAIMNFLSGIEVFRDIPQALKKGKIDCDNIAVWRAAELRMAGVKAIPMITSRKRDDGGTTYHALVRWPDNTSEDPSILLGMGGESKAAERREEARKNRERRDNLLQAARVLVSRGGDAAALGRQIDAMCLVPMRGPHRGWLDIDGGGERVGYGRRRAA